VLFNEKKYQKRKSKEKIWTKKEIKNNKREEKK
jgi:hypothetical protein